MQKRHGIFASVCAFTLSELLLVVAVLAILVAIAVPNLLNAQIRAKVARTKNALRVVASSFEAYNTDNHAYPPHMFPAGWLDQYHRLTTPIAYLVSNDMALDPFPPIVLEGTTWGEPYFPNLHYDLTGGESAELIRFREPLAGHYGPWVLLSFGPSRIAEPYDVMTLDPAGTITPSNRARLNIYDPTNGVTSEGVIGWSQKLGLLDAHN